MQLHNAFRVPVPVGRAWEVLTDIARIAPCLPGARLLSADEGIYTLAVKVKVGPITAQYQGTAEFVEQDAAAHRAVIRAVGRETRGQGNASALVTAVLSPDGEGTAVQLETDLTISGKAAQFGRGVLADVSGRLIDQFARNLEADLTEPTVPAEPVPVPAAPDVSAGAVAVVVPSTGSDAPPVDVLGTAALPVAKRVVPVVAVLVVVALLLRRVVGRRR